MLVYVEGIDKSGKSTFIRNFSFDFNIQVFKKTLPESLDISHHHYYFKGVGFGVLELYNLLKVDIILDRSFISDWIYSNRDSRKLSYSIWKEWEEWHQKDTTFVLYFDVNEETFKERIRANPDFYMKESEFSYYVKLYEEYLSKTNFPVIRINGSDPYEQQIKTIFSVRNDSHFQQSFNTLLLIK